MITKDGKMYHTGVKKSGNNGYYHQCKRCEREGNIAFQHDMTHGAHDDFFKAECIYSEPSWRDGYVKFVEKSGVEAGGDYNKYLDNIRETIKNINKPSYILMGKSMISRLKPDFTFQVFFEEHNVNCFIGVYNAEKDEICEAKSNHEVIKALCKKYGTVLDFSCGFGNIVPYCLKENTNFIVSDICGDCIGYIAEKYMGGNNERA